MQKALFMVSERRNGRGKVRSQAILGLVSVNNFGGQWAIEGGS